MMILLQVLIWTAAAWLLVSLLQRRRERVVDTRQS
jgi:hypothetical protein